MCNLSTKDALNGIFKIRLDNEDQILGYDSGRISPAQERESMSRIALENRVFKAKNCVLVPKIYFDPFLCGIKQNPHKRGGPSAHKAQLFEFNG